MSTKTVFNAYGHYYDLLYQDKDYAAEVKYIHSLLCRFGIQNGNLLEFGSGTGRHASLLVKYGYQVHGVDQSIEMVLQSEEVDGFTCQQGDICKIRLNKTFDAVLSLFHVISYQTSNTQLNEVFLSASQHLTKGGVFVFDFWYSPAVYTQSPSVRIKRMRNDCVEILRIAEPVVHVNENCVDVNYTILAQNLDSNEMQTVFETHKMRHFSLPEIDLVAMAHGFERVCDEEFLSGNVLGIDTWGACVVLRRV